MTKIVRKASAGTLESSDVMIELSPSDALEVAVESVVKQQFGAAIESAVRDVLQSMGVQAAAVRVVDRGALECVIRARTETAVRRGKGEE